MKYQKIINLIGDDFESRFQTKQIVEVNDESRNDYQDTSEIPIKTTILSASLCDFINAYIKVSGRVIFTCLTASQRGRATFKNCAPFRECKVEINNTAIAEQEHLDVTTPMYNLIEYSDNYAKTLGSECCQH